MKKKALLPLFLGIMIFLAGCDYSTPEKQDGFFFNTFVQPMKHLLQWLGNDVFHNNFGLAIIVLVLFIRLILLPFMLSNYKNSHMMREKMKVAKPEVDGIQEKVKRARTQEEKMAANQELMEVYKKYDMNPMKSMLGCLPIWITVIAGVLYFIQAVVSSKTMPQEQRQMGYMMMVISPIMIIWISLQASSALGLYWSVSALFLVIQTHFANIYYSKLAKKEVQPFIEKYEREHNP
ncbi:MAG: YidC/Oxa1 family membrane protein insertase, partial [Staphylococcus epidermidis]|nr:YidC/Oxa1 family membrane protein insertase [Staphylococcus epidermidis]